MKTERRPPGPVERPPQGKDLTEMIGLGTQKGLVAPIVERRKALGISVKQLAEMANVHRNTIANMENGKRVPNWETRQKLRKALGMPEERYFTVQQRNEIFAEFDSYIWYVINQNRHILDALHADEDDVYQDMALCAIRAIDRYNPEISTASVKTFVMKNVEMGVKHSFEYFRCCGLGGKAAKSLGSGVVISLNFMLEAGMQFAACEPGW